MNGRFNNNNNNKCNRFCLALWAVCAIVSMMAGHASADDYVVSEGNRSLMVALGCFWCAEQAFEQYAPGVVEAVSGYAGGINDNPSELLVNYIYFSSFLVDFGLGCFVGWWLYRMRNLLSRVGPPFSRESFFSTIMFQKKPTGTIPAITR
jgi:hypothetical protein